MMLKHKTNATLPASTILILVGELYILRKNLTLLWFSSSVMLGSCATKEQLLQANANHTATFISSSILSSFQEYT